MASDPIWYAEEMRQHVDALVYGFSEHIDFVVEVRGGYERRGCVRRFDSLLSQLWTNSITPLAVSGQSSGSSPNKAGSRSPVNQVYADLIDTIHEQANDAWSLLEGESSPPCALPVLLGELHSAVARCPVDNAGAAHQVVRMAAEWVRRARVALGYETRTVQLADSVCGQCGGTLVVAADASTDVRCIGTSAAESCGMVYGRMQWLALALNVS